MFQYNQLQALKQMVGGQQLQNQIVQNYNKGSVFNPGNIGSDGKKTEIAKPFTKIQAKMGKKYQKKEQQPMSSIPSPSPSVSTKPNKSTTNKNAIWTQQQISELPTSKNDLRKIPQFQTMYRQRVGTEDIFLGLNGVDPTSINCQQLKYVIHLPGVETKEISLDINEKAMVVQTKEFYLHQYFQYKVEPNECKAKFLADKGVLELILLVTRELIL